MCSGASRWREAQQDASRQSSAATFAMFIACCIISGLMLAAWRCMAASCSGVMRLIMSCSQQAVLTLCVSAGRVRHSFATHSAAASAAVGTAGSNVTLPTCAIAIISGLNMVVQGPRRLAAGCN